MVIAYLGAVFLQVGVAGTNKAVNPVISGTKLAFTEMLY
jgi:hypothetical protein